MICVKIKHDDSERELWSKALEAEVVTLFEGGDKYDKIRKHAIRSDTPLSTYMSHLQLVQASYKPIMCVCSVIPSFC